MSKRLVFLQCLITVSFARTRSTYTSDVLLNEAPVARTILAQFFLQQVRIPHAIRSSSNFELSSRHSAVWKRFPSSFMQESNGQMRDAWLEIVNSLEGASEAMSKASVEAAQIAAIEAKCVAGDYQACDILAREEDAIADVRASWDSAAKTISQVSDIISSSSSYLGSLSEEELENVWNAERHAANALNQFVQEESQRVRLGSHHSRTFPQYVAAKQQVNAGTSLSQTTSSSTEVQDKVATDENKEESREGGNLMTQIKDAGVAGILSYMFWELAFWSVSIPVCIFAYYTATGHFPDFSNQEDVTKLSAEAFAFVNLARFAVPFRISLALGTTPWVKANIVDKFGLGKDGR